MTRHWRACGPFVLRPELLSLCDRLGHRYGCRPSTFVDELGDMTPAEARTFDVLCFEVAMAEIKAMAGRKDAFIACAVVL